MHEQRSQARADVTSLRHPLSYRRIIDLTARHYRHLIARISSVADPSNRADPYPSSAELDDKSARGDGKGEEIERRIGVDGRVCAGELIVC